MVRVERVGFYSVDPASAHYSIGTPFFDRAEIEVGSDRTLVIEARLTNPEDKYIQSLTFNGQPYDKLWLEHADLACGSKLVFSYGRHCEQRARYSYLRGASLTYGLISLTACLDICKE